MSGQVGPQDKNLSMRQLFAPGADAILRLVALTLVGGVLAIGLLLYGWAHGDLYGSVGIAPEQPVPFSHKHHSGELGIDCRNCHLQVENFATAGLPQTYTCMTCHSQIWTNATILAPVRESLAQNQPLHWVRVNRLPNYVFYNHSIHIDKGVGCSTCHGPVNTMQLTYPAQSFRMEFCINCHRNPEPQLRPASEIWNMEWVPPADQAERGAILARENHIASGQRLSDCSICHR